MANLIPRQELERIWTAYRARIIIVFSIVMLCGAAFVTLALVPSALAVGNARATLMNAASASTTQSQIQSDKLAITTANFDSAQLASVLISSSTPPEETIAAILAQEPQGMRIDQITYTPGPSGSILLGGTAASGDAVNAFRTALSQNPRFTSVSVPVASLIGAQTGAFTITIAGSF